MRVFTKLMNRGMPAESRSQRGDTIIEVLIAMTVIGIVLGAAFGIANRALQTGRAAQEQTEALKVAESQLELMKAFLRSSNNNIQAFAAPFCIDRGASDPLAAAVATSNAICNNIDPNGVSGSGLYSVSITEDLGTYKVAVSWTRVGTESDDPGQLVLYYRLGGL